MNRHINHGVPRCLLTLTLLISITVQAEVKLPAIFSDGMVMQQQANACLWGMATPKKKVNILTGWDGRSYSVTTDAQGDWRLSVTTPVAGGPYTLSFTEGKTTTLNNVLIGELWFCSGQSNMEMPMKGFKNQPVEGSNLEILKSRNPRLRLFTVERTSTIEPQSDVIGTWQEAAPLSVREFSATAYYFGRLMQEMLDVPVGLVVASWGGSSAEAWMAKEMLHAFPEVKIPLVPGDIKEKNRTPTALYQGMIHPLVGLAIKGVIWYQGESNYDRADSYASLFGTLIQGWRKVWGQGDFPFYYCQIAPYDYSIITEKGKEVINSAYLREAQTKVEQLVKNTGMAVLMDAGLEKGIHPTKKQVVGERLAFLALTKTYGIEGVTGESPCYKEFSIQGDTVIVSFERAPMWISTSKESGSCLFTVAGEDKVFYPACAWVVRSKMYVHSDKVKHPVAVRYAFDNYVQGDLYGCEGLPVSSFRSDNW